MSIEESSNSKMESPILNQIYDSLFEKLNEGDSFTDEEIQMLTVLRENDQLHLKDSLRVALMFNSTKKTENEDS
jgi:hypothetical protein